MSRIYLLVALGYVLFALAVVQIEFRRTRARGIDVTTVFIGLCMIQCCIPGIAIYSFLPLVDRAAPTGIDAFDRVYHAMDPTLAFAVLLLTVWFVLFIYIGSGLGRLILSSERLGGRKSYSFLLSVSLQRTFVVLAVGLLLTLLSFYLLGDSLPVRYANLILLRAGAPEIERTALNANAFALTQTWGFLAILAIFAAYETKGRGGAWIIAILLALVFAVLGVSRRALFLPIIFCYFTVSLQRAKFRLKWIAIAAVPMLLLLAYGKEILASVAFGIDVDTVSSNYQSLASAMLRAFSDSGLTIIESVGTLAFLHLDPRLGVDHVLSMLQRFPEGMLGWDFNFPERIVRVSTTAFADANAQDIPPGIVGQMWLDFRLLGPVVWGLAFGLQVSVLQALYVHTVKSYQSAAAFVLLAFVVVLPINTGSFDFSFNVDMIALVAALAFCVTVRREPVTGAIPSSQTLMLAPGET
ncbi:MAG TPA: hypothetical protein VJ865_02485 [Gemmatimonadaceae bacterium]|nr:hypothetical protein [Gemmatimonadaceae bacterium]